MSFVSHLAAAVPDPRIYPDIDSVPAPDAAIYALAAESLAAPTARDAQAADRRLRRELEMPLHEDGARLARLRDSAPAVDIARHLWRQIDALARSAGDRDRLRATIFALPLVIVTGIEGTRGEGTMSGVLPDAAALAALLREHRALAGNLSFGLADVLAGVDAIDLPQLPALLEWERLPDALGGASASRALEPRPLAFTAGREAVYLRFLLGSALAAPGVEFLAETEVGRWGVPLTRELGRQLGTGQAAVLALPRAPGYPLPAVEQGQKAQREVSAQIFASNAIRKLRASVGEPSAVVSAHRAAGAPGGGELRMSLSSPFEPRDAEGFRCPLYPLDRVSDVAGMLLHLLSDCRVADVRVLEGVHGDRVAGTTHPLLFKPETIPPNSEMRLH
jgi:hypothetical protein